MVAKEDRDRYIDRSVMVNMALLKKTWAEKAMTGAKLQCYKSSAWCKRHIHKGGIAEEFRYPNSYIFT